MKPNWKKVNELCEKVEKRLGDSYENFFGNMTGDEFSLIMQNLLISEDGYVIDTGGKDNVNYACAYSLMNKIKKHPIIWKLFFMIA